MRESFSRSNGPLSGSYVVPGDKSLSHRAVLFAAMAEGTSRLQGLLDSADVRSSIAAVSALGAQVALAVQPDGSLAGTVGGWGARGPTDPERPLDCGNSGTTVRLLMGILAGHPLNVDFVGDPSLSSRPMRRVTSPLETMGARFALTENGTLPATLHGASLLTAIQFSSPVASAQVKSAVLLAGLRAAGTTTVAEPVLSRDHTERLLPAFGIAVHKSGDGLRTSIQGPAVPHAFDVAVPGDPSTAAFLIAAALIVPGSKVTVRGISLNATRVGFLEVLRRMGAWIEIVDARDVGSESVGDVRVQFSGRLQAASIVGAEVPSLVDEIPVLALLAALAEGVSRFGGIGELRVKETDRHRAIADGLEALGVATQSGPDWIEISGQATIGYPQGVSLDSRGDHRLAMTWALAGLVAQGTVSVERFEAVKVSFPGFVDALRALGA